MKRSKYHLKEGAFLGMRFEIRIPVSGIIPELTKDEGIVVSTSALGEKIYSKDKEVIGEISAVWAGDEQSIIIYFEKVPIELRKFFSGCRMGKKGFPWSMSKKGFIRKKRKKK